MLSIGGSGKGETSTGSGAPDAVGSDGGAASCCAGWLPGGGVGGESAIAFDAGRAV
jgi:hypothetical protein